MEIVPSNKPIIATLKLKNAGDGKRKQPKNRRSPSVAKVTFHRQSSQIVSGQFVNVLMSDSFKRGTTLTALNATFSLWLLPALKERPFVAHRYLLGREMCGTMFQQAKKWPYLNIFCPRF